MIRPLNMAVLRFSVYFLPDQCLLDLNPKHMTDLPTYLPQAPAGDMCGLSSSVVSDSATPWTAAHQALLSMEFSSLEYWSGFPFPPPGESSKPRDRTCVS